MQHFDAQTIKDLEFDRIRVRVADYCHNETATERAESLLPLKSHSELRTELHLAKEFLRIREEGEAFPAIDFDELGQELRMLKVRDSVLPEASFVAIYRASALTNAIVYFFNKREEEFPTLVSLLHSVHHTNDITKLIDKVFDKRGQIKDDASDALREIRQQKASLIKQINRVFDRESAKLAKQGILSDTREAFLSNRRVLSVQSTYKRQIEGNMHGSSRTGAVSYIEPRTVVPLNNDLEQAIEAERLEIYRILKALTKAIAEFLPLLHAYQDLLTTFDFIQAKVRLAQELDADLPALSDETQIELINAYHPLLLLSNKASGNVTLPQSLSMDKFGRMLVISGPNAGGKTITLKTVGLLQVMLQSGLLVPADANSKMCFFNAVLTDIGDNQSIENHLSTYSYRLKRMKHFLEVANRKTLLLLDEFGTGSDPDLGGALAEVFFESLYNRKCFGVITTHYANIKLKAAQLRNAINSCMLFDMETLEPLFRLSVGQPGSSFTFEVAQLNGIPMDLIDQAKEKMDGHKVRMDQLLSSLQNEKTHYEKLTETSANAQSAAERAKLAFEEKKGRFEQRLEKQQALIDENNVQLQRGQRLSRFIERYKLGKGAGETNKQVLKDFKEYLTRERTKIEEGKKAAKLKEQEKVKRKKAKEVAHAKRNKPKHHRDRIKVGSVVKLLSTKQQGTVVKLAGTKASVAFNFMKMTVELDQLSWIS